MADDQDKTIQVPQQPTEKVSTADGYQYVKMGFQPISEGFQPTERGYKPAAGSGQAPSNPPQGGTGVPSKPQPVSNISQSQAGDKK
jgi:hypothetical protein